MESNFSLYLLYYAEACNVFSGFISGSLHPDNAASVEKMLQRWRAAGNTVSDLTGPRFEPQTSRSTDECITAWPIAYTIRIIIVIWDLKWYHLLLLSVI